MAYGRRKNTRTGAYSRKKTGYRSSSSIRRPAARSARRPRRSTRAGSRGGEIRLVIVQEPATPVARPFTAAPEETAPKKGKF